MSEGVQTYGFFDKVRDHQPKIMDGLLLIAGIAGCVFLAILASKQRIFHAVAGESKYGFNQSYHTYTLLGGLSILGSVTSLILAAKGAIGLFIKCFREREEILPEKEPCRNLEDNSKKQLFILGMSTLALLSICIFTALRVNKGLSVVQEGKYTETVISAAGYGYIVTSVLTGLSAIVAAALFLIREEGLDKETITTTDITRIRNKCSVKDLAAIVNQGNSFGMSQTRNGNFGPHGLRMGQLTERDVSCIRGIVNQYIALQSKLEAYKEQPLKPDATSRALIQINEKLKAQNARNAGLRAGVATELTRLEQTWQDFLFDPVAAVPMPDRTA